MSVGRVLVMITTLVMLSETSLLAAERESITVKSSSVGKDVVLVDIDIRGKALQLTCFKSASDCQIPRPGGYLMERLRGGKGIYMDCQNVDLYEQPANKIGEYCLLE